MFDTSTILIMAAILCFAAFIQGFSGFGMALIAVPLMSGLGDIKTIVPLCLFASAGSTWLLLFVNWRTVNVKPLLPLIIAGVLGVPFGVYFLTNAPAVIVMRILAIVIFIVVGAQMLAGKNLIGKPTTPKGMAAGFLSGILGGAFGTSGPPLVVYLHMTCDPKLARSSLYFAFTAIGIVSLFDNWRYGHFTLSIITTGLMIMPAGMIGGQLGNWMASKVHPEPFKKLVLGLLIGLGVMLFFRR